ncbi:helix-turn-helix domain-containing protein [Streptomyces pactum]|uniref:helix-turn-helix domain-containing protein n=1 Tax=Streptomyces pactum TaxID=68249 RepID=UPI0036F6D6B7
MTLEPGRLGESKKVLALRLRELRRRAGLTGDRLAKRCHMSQSQISKFETGKKTPGLVDVERILRALNAPQELVSEITALARIANTEWQDKRSSWRRGLGKRQTELAALEAEATESRYFLPSMITGLLATPEYIRASLSHSPGDTAKTVAAKLSRQGVLRDPSKVFTFILTEQAARWPIVPPPAMAAQLDHLVALSSHPGLQIGVIPLGVPMTRGPLNTFTVYDSWLATVETFTGRMVFRDPRDIEYHLDLFSQYQRLAVFGETARAHLTEWAATYRG